MQKDKLLFIAVIGAVLLFMIFFLNDSAVTKVTKDQVSPSIVFKRTEEIKENNQTLFVGDTVIKIEIADTKQKRQQGLSGRSFLEPENGLLFVFDKLDFHGIWMKNMRFPIDILWFDADLRIVDIKKGAQPQSYPEIFYPQEPALYVLEVNTGFSEENSITVGEKAYRTQ